MAARKSKLWGAVALVLLAAGLAVVLWRSEEQTSGGPASVAPSSASASASAGTARGGSKEWRAPLAAWTPPSLKDDAELQKLSDFLHSRYGGEKLNHAYLRMRLIEELMRYFQKRFPDTWQQALLAFVREAYPERYEELAALLRARLDYETWIRENEVSAQKLGDEERRKNVWAERERLFGKEQAQEIWASELKSQAVTDSLAALDARTDLKVSDKVKLYRDSLKETYGEAADTFLERHRQEAMNRFLDLSSVQKELSGLSAGERSKSLRDIRSNLGMDAETLRRWDTLDTERDKRWDAGAQYMREREALSQQYSGPALEDKLRPLRERYFGAEADTIGSEEQSGFFRFTRPRVWGRN